MTGFWDYVHALRSRFYVVLPAALAGALIGLVIAQVQHKQYSATTRLLVESQRPRFVGTDAEGGVHMSDQSEMQTQALLVRSQAVAGRCIAKLGLESKGPFVGAENVVEALLDSIRVKPIRDTRFLEVSCETTDREWAPRIADEVAQSYIEENLERRRDRLSEVTGVYSLRYPDLNDKLQAAESELLKFQESYLVVSSEDPESTLRQRELKLIEHLSSAQRDRISAQARMMQLKDEREVPLGSTPDPSLARAIAAEDPWVRQLLEQRLNQAARIVELRQSFSEGHRDLETAGKRLAEIEKELREAIDGYTSHARRAFEAAWWKEEEVARILEEHRKQIAGLRQVLSKYDVLRQRRDSLHKLLDPLAKSQAELDLAKELGIAGSTIVDRAQIPRQPSRPVRANYVVIGCVLGLLLGVRIAFALESSDAAVRTREDVQAMTGLPSIGMVARIDGGLATDVHSRANAFTALPSSRAAEQFRSIRTSILASAQWKDRARGGAVLVTSANLGEGKSFVAANMAAAFAQLGKPVVLIDADLRRSSVHEELRVARSPGLADILSGSASAESAIRHTGIANLDVVTAGSPTERPAELLASQAMREFMLKLTAAYATVWIDSPPIIPIADARDVAPLADMILLVVRSGVTRHKALLQACELLRLADGQVLSALVNDVSEGIARRYGYSRQGYYVRGEERNGV